MRKTRVIFFGLSVLVALGLFYWEVALAETAQIKIISAPQNSVVVNASSSIFTIEAQDADGNKVNVSTTTHISLVSSSGTGQFASASATGPCGNTWTLTSLTISNGTSHKSFCYMDSSIGNFTISVAVSDASAVTGDSQQINITASTSNNSSKTSDITTTTPSSLQSDASSTPSQLTQSFKVKIYRFLPNPAGEDSANEWVELKSSDEKEVNIDGWLLDDKNTGSGPASSALVLSGIILPGEIKRIGVPTGSFSLNNSGGDEVNLYFSDKTLADKVVYTAASYDDGIFEFQNGAWQPPQQQTTNVGSSGGGSTASVTNNYSGPIVAFKLNEIFPNPVGDDTGKEWIEIYNPTNATGSLAGYFLVDGDSEIWSSSAWAIPTGTEVSALGVKAVVLPKDSFVLNNSGQQKVKLFSPSKQLLDFIVYKDAPENQSYSKNEKNIWQWTIPTFNLANDQIPPVLSVIISEILPRPFADDQEFIELYNTATSTQSLAGAVLQLGSRNKIFVDSDEIKPGEFLVIYEDDLPTRLNNSGQTLKLLDAFGREVAAVTYDKAEAGFSYGASLDGKNYSWSSEATPGEPNSFVLGDSTSSIEKAAVAKATLPSAKAAAPALTKTQATKLLKDNAELKTQVAMLQSSLTKINVKLDSNNNSSQPKQLENSSRTASSSIKPAILRWLGIALGISFLLGLLFWLFKYSHIGSNN